MPKVRIKLRSMKIEDLNNICSQIKEIASKAGIPVSGPIPLPTKKLKITTRNSMFDFLGNPVVFLRQNIGQFHYH